MQPFHRRRPPLPYMHAPVASVPILNFRNGTNEKKSFTTPFSPSVAPKRVFRRRYNQFSFFSLPRIILREVLELEHLAPLCLLLVVAAMTPPPVSFPSLPRFRRRRRLRLELQ